MMNILPVQLLAFGMTVSLLWQKISKLDTNQATHFCDDKQFYLALPGIARFLALPEDKCIIIERAHADIPVHILNTWLLGTVMAYILQYHGYVVLHGSAVLINDKAIIFSGQSGAGKSTMAGALLEKNHLFITDDLVVIKRNFNGQYCIIPGPLKLKLWNDSMHHLNHDTNDALPVNLKTDKYAIQVTHCCNLPDIPISAFYELNVEPHNTTFACEQLNDLLSLRTIIDNAYRYFMLKPLGKLQNFFYDCNMLAQQLTVHKLTRTSDFFELAQIIQHIELNQGINV